MKIAVQNSWPNLAFSAEKELILRFKIACENLKFDFCEVITSEDIIREAPDVVLATHEYTPKLTTYPTIGLIWSPPDFYKNDMSRVKNILSYDGIIPGSEDIRAYVTDLYLKSGKSGYIANEYFYPSTHAVEYKELNFEFPSIFYVGAHWDGKRHKNLFKSLANKFQISFYGDPKKLDYIGDKYKGSIPFDGTSIIGCIQKNQVVLALHKKEHLKYNTPSMRIFEGAAASALIITEKTTFAEKYFGESILYIDSNQSKHKQLLQIEKHMKWIADNPKKAKELSKKSHEIFSSNFSLEKQLQNIPKILKELRTSNIYNIVETNKAPMVEVIVRVGSRNIQFIERCLDSISRQSYQNIGLIIVKFKDVDRLDSLLDGYNKRFTSIKIITSKLTGYRSTALWDGLRAVSGEYFCNQDDDDTIQSNHIATLVNILEEKKSSDVAYSGTVQVQEDGVFFDYPNFKGNNNTIIKENRKLVFFDDFDKYRMYNFDNHVQSNSWLARSPILNKIDLNDPCLYVEEDIFLYFSFMKYEKKFLFSWKPTAEWYWREISGENSMMSVDRQVWLDCGRKIIDVYRDECYTLKVRSVYLIRKKFPRIIDFSKKIFAYTKSLWS